MSSPLSDTELARLDADPRLQKVRTEVAEVRRQVQDALARLDIIDVELEQFQRSRGE